MNLEPEQHIQEYILVESLSEYSNIWQAFDDNSQREVVLKFVEDKVAADRESLVLADVDHPNILKLLRRFSYEGISVLVFEYVSGVRLDKAIRQGFTQEQSYKVCIDICSALISVHQFGLYHGDLSPFNVIWSNTKNKAYLIDFGSTGGCTVLSAAPEHDPDSRTPLGPYTDMVGFGRILMSLFPKMKGLYEKCLQDSPNLRPTAKEVLKTLVKSRDRGKIVSVVVIPVTLVVLIGILIYAINASKKSLRPEQQIARLSAVVTFENRNLLRKLLSHDDFRGFEDRIVKSIADMNDALGEEMLVVSDIQDIAAVFNTKEYPLIIFGDGILHLGYWAQFENNIGYLAEINKGTFIIKTRNGSKEYRYTIPFVQEVWQTQEYRPITIYPRRFNLEMILSAVADVTQKEIISESFDGIISGGFYAETYFEFLDSLSHVQYNEFHVWVNASRSPVSIIGGENYWNRRSTIPDYLQTYEPHLGTRCVYEGNRPDLRLVYPQMQFHEFLEVMGLEYTVQDGLILVYEKGR